MKLLFVVQRYGEQVAGGAESHCRSFATRLASRGHSVDVATSCAVSYVDWANYYPSGKDNLDGVNIFRFPVLTPRPADFFGPLNTRVVWGNKKSSIHLQKTWMTFQGPYLPELGLWLRQNSPSYDRVIFFTYLYYTTWAGISSIPGSVPAILHPTAHEEPSFFLELFDTTLRHVDAFAFSTPEEKALVKARLGGHLPYSSEIGIGIELDITADSNRFRQNYPIGQRPYLLFLGRVDPGKGSQEILDYFLAYKQRNKSDLALVLIGDKVTQVPDHKDIISTGFVDEQTKKDAISGALALVQPSYFESFSLSLVEAWAQNIPALVQGRCDVLAGQAFRSGGGIPYRGFAEFEQGLTLLIENPHIAKDLGSKGRKFVEEKYSWDTVLAKYERFLYLANTTK